MRRTTNRERNSHSPNARPRPPGPRRRWFERLALVVIAGLVVAVGLSSAVQPVAAFTQTFTPTDDTYTSSATPTTVRGTYPYMGVRADATGQPKRSFLKFTVSGVNGPVTSATLRVFAQWNSAAGIEVRSVADTSWSENTVTFTNAPAYSSTVTSATQHSYSANTWQSLDVTPLVTGNGTYSFAITTPSGETQLSTKESGPDQTPQLIVQSVAPPSNTSPPTISGTPQDGQTLTANNGSWTGDTPIGYGYQWRHCDASGGNCADIGSATAQTYAVTSSDVGSTIRVTVTASNSA